MVLAAARAGPPASILGVLAGEKGVDVPVTIPPVSIKLNSWRRRNWRDLRVELPLTLEILDVVDLILPDWQIPARASGISGDSAASGNSAHV